MRTSVMAAVLAAAGLLGTVGQGRAAFLTFTNNPTTNSTDFNTAVTGLGGSINSNVNFNSQPLGVLNPLAYSASDGVTLTAAGDSNTVASGAGPGDGNASTAPLSSGEGLHAPSNYLFDGGQASSLTISFSAPVFGAGLFVIDYFNPFGDNPLVLEAYTGVNGTGTLLGTATSASFNFQNNFLYFMGVASTDGNIRSVVFRDVNDITGDVTGLDDIRFAPAGVTTVATPAPAGLVVALLGAAGLGVLRRRAV